MHQRCLAPVVQLHQWGLAPVVHQKAGKSAFSASLHQRGLAPVVHLHHGGLAPLVHLRCKFTEA